MKRRALRRRTRLRPRSAKAARRPRNREYMQWIKRQPCVVCGRGGSEAAHTGPRAYGRKAPDEQCIPLCHRHHREYPGSLDVVGPRAFEDLYELRIAEVVRGCRERWQRLGTVVTTDQ